MMTSPSLKPSSPALSASKSYSARQQGWDERVGVEAGDGLGETAGAVPQAGSQEAPAGSDASRSTDPALYADTVHCAATGGASHRAA